MATGCELSCWLLTSLWEHTGGPQPWSRLILRERATHIGFSLGASPLLCWLCWLHTPVLLSWAAAGVESRRTKAEHHHSDMLRAGLLLCAETEQQSISSPEVVQASIADGCLAAEAEGAKWSCAQENWW